MHSRPCQVEAGVRDVGSRTAPSRRWHAAVCLRIGRWGQRRMPVLIMGDMSRPTRVKGTASWATSPGIRRTMRSNRSADTVPERALRSAVHALGLRFRANHRIEAAGVHVRPDMVFTARRVCVFSDGCFWHRCPEHATDPKANSDYWAPKLLANVERDRRVDEALRSEGWTVIRVWEHEDPGEAAERVAALISLCPSRRR